MAENNNWFLYKHTCPNGKVYIGITGKTPEIRWKKGWGYRSNAHFWRAIQKYGWDNIQHEIILENLSKKDACKLEKLYIKQYKSNDKNFGYNKSTGGEFPAEGFKHTEESKEKIANAFRGRFIGELNPMYGIHNNHICDENGHLPKEIKDKLSKAAKNRMATDKEWAAKMQFYNEKKMRSVNQYDLNGNFIQQFKSRNIAQKETGICAATIHKVCKRLVDPRTGSMSKTAGGYQWRFSDDCNDISMVMYKEPKRNSGGKNHNAVKINQYDRNGKYIKTWSCIRDAAKFYKINDSTINGALNENNHKMAKGFQWRRFEDYSDCLNIEKYEHKHDYSYCMKKVAQYDLNDNLLKIYDSGKIASVKTNISQTCISSCCKGRTKTAGGYIWRYAS